MASSEQVVVFEEIEPLHLREYAETETAAMIKRLTERDDLVTMLIRCHLTTEHFLDRIIEANLPRGNHLLSKGRLRFAQKIYVVDSFGRLDESDISALKKLNTIRNKCSHTLDITLGIADIDEFGRTLGRTYTELRQRHHEQLNQLLVSTFAYVYAHLLALTYRLEHPEQFDGPPDFTS